MNDAFWYPREPMVYLTDTLTMEPLAECAYNRFLEFYYASGKPLPDDDAQLKMLGKVKDQDWARIKGAILGMGFKAENGVLRHAKCDETLARMQEKRALKQNQTATARATKALTDPVTDPVTGREIERELELEIEVQKEKKKNSRSASNDEWLSALERCPAYSHISIRDELAKMVEWCSVNNRKPTKRTFVNWINRIEKPLTSGKPHGANSKHSQQGFDRNKGTCNEGRAELYDLKTIQAKREVRDDGKPVS